MVKMTDLFGEDAEAEVLEQFMLGNITLRSHPDDAEYLIANYTPKAAYDGEWNDITLASRGLIFHTITEEVLARPFAKFFNYGQTGAPQVALTTEITATNKFDGSLGIAYMAPDGHPAIATRGSFASEQAIHATKVLRRDADLMSWILDELSDGWTPLFEIIYPENRIVLDYGDRDYLQYLGSMRNDTGAFFPYGDELLTFGDLLARPDRPNAEGYVVWLDRHTAVKLKQEDYVALHSIVTGLNEKSVWREVQKGPEEFNAFVANLPDELQDWANAVAAKLNIEFSVIMRYIDELYLAVSEGEPDGRKEFALEVQRIVPDAYRGYMFNIADGKDYQDKVWKLIEPRGNVGFRNVVEEES